MYKPNGQYYPTSINWVWSSSLSMYILVMYYLHPNQNEVNTPICSRAFINPDTFEIIDDSHAINWEYIKYGLNLTWYTTNDTYNEKYLDYRIQYFSSDNVLGFEPYGPFYADSSTNGIRYLRYGTLESTGNTKYNSNQNYVIPSKGELLIPDEWNSDNYINYFIVDCTNGSSSSSDRLNVLRYRNVYSTDITSDEIPIYIYSSSDTTLPAADYLVKYRRLIYASPHILMSNSDEISSGPYIGCYSDVSDYKFTLDEDTVASYLGENASIGLYENGEANFTFYAINFDNGSTIKIKGTTGEIIDSWTGESIPYTKSHSDPKFKSIYFDIGNYNKGELFYTRTNLRYNDKHRGHVPGEPYCYGTSMYGAWYNGNSAGFYSCEAPVNSYVSVNGGRTWHDTGYPISQIING